MRSNIAQQRKWLQYDELSSGKGTRAAENAKHGFCVCIFIHPSIHVSAACFLIFGIFFIFKGNVCLRSISQHFSVSQ